ncbi:MAG: hypothetical protein CMJ75_01275 [Planctomycetaceae bacterium]|nr:hypothetical protein [Planctomycetaceae bacterium]
MLFRLQFHTLFLSLVSLSAAQPAEQLRMKQIRSLSIPTDDGQQGIATDGKYLYVQNTQQLFKYDLNGALLKTGSRQKYHHGGITWVAGRLYCAVSGCEPTGSPIQRVHVYDPRTFQLLQQHDVSTHFAICAGGIAYRRNHFYLAASYFDDDHPDTIVQFDAHFKHVKTHRVAFRSPFGIQGLEYLPDTDQFQIHSHGRDFYRINPRFDLQSLVRGQADFELQDLARFDKQTLLVNHRDAAKLLFVRIVSSGH